VVDVAYDNPMDSVVFKLMEGKEDNAVKVAESLGFKRVATLPNFVKDHQGYGAKVSQPGNHGAAIGKLAGMVAAAFKLRCQVPAGTFTVS
jgi:hypothetical protein